MTKRMWFFPLIIIISLLAGCGPSPSPSDYSETKNQTAQLIANFETAVEGYLVPQMLGCLSADTFKLTIVEAGFSKTKTYLELKSELEADEEKQLAWRKPTELGGHAYVLDLVLGALSYTNTTATGTYANQTFEVWESADKIPKMKTDKGAISWKVVKSGGEWKATEMTIEYLELNKSKISAMQARNSARGFGFSRLIFQ